MPIYEAMAIANEDGELVAICPECEGTGRGERLELFATDCYPSEDPYCGEGIPPDCDVCCGFGRLDW